MSIFNFHCPHCETKIEVDSQYEGHSSHCPECSTEIIVPDAPKAKSRAYIPEPEPVAVQSTIKKAPNQGCAVILLGILIGGGIELFISPVIGGVVFIILLAIGIVALCNKKHTCGACGNLVEKTSTLCPICRATFPKPRRGR